MAIQCRLFASCGVSHRRDDLTVFLATLLKIPHLQMKSHVHFMDAASSCIALIFDSIDAFIAIFRPHANKMSLTTRPPSRNSFALAIGAVICVVGEEREDGACRR